MESKTVNFIKVKEASAYFGVTKATVINWYNRGLLEGRKFSKTILLDRDSVYKGNSKNITKN
jgi:transposase